KTKNPGTCLAGTRHSGCQAFSRTAWSHPKFRGRRARCGPIVRTGDLETRQGFEVQPGFTPTTGSPSSIARREDRLYGGSALAPIGVLHRIGSVKTRKADEAG